MKLYCTKCNYKFQKNIIPPRCPYCSADGAVKETEQAQDIIDETMNDMDMIEKSRKERGV